ncbi:MAG: hypothetical protein RSC93_02495 [Erysipelotrichaceae bacterium]
MLIIEYILEKILMVVACVFLLFIDLQKLFSTTILIANCMKIFVVIYILITILESIVILIQYKKGKKLTPGLFSFISHYIFKK